MQNRRIFLNRLLVGAGLVATESMISAASANASALESTVDRNAALTEAQRELYSIGRAHMEPGADSAELRSRALAVWRDAVALRADMQPHAKHIWRAHSVEARAAGLVAQFFGDRGRDNEASVWFESALSVAPDRETISWLLSCAVWMPLYKGKFETATRQAHMAAGMMGNNSFQYRERVMFAHGQLARAMALSGDAEGARRALSVANTQHVRMTDEHKKTKPNLLFFTPVQHHQYMADTLATLAFGSDSKPSDVERAELHLTEVESSEYAPNGMNKVVMELARAKVLASGSSADPEAAVEHSMNVLGALSRDDRTSAVVVGKARQFSGELESRFGKTRAVRGFVGFTSEMAKAA